MKLSLKCLFSLLGRSILWTLLAFVVGLLVIALSAYLVTQLSGTRPLLSKILHADVKYRVASATWNHGHPQLTLQNITITASGQKQAAVAVKEIHMTIDLQDTLLYLRPSTDQILVSGLALRMRQQENGLYALVGWPSARTNSSAIRWYKIWAWLEPQESIAFKNAHIHAYDIEGHYQSRSDLGFVWKHQDDKEYSLTTELSGVQAGKRQAYSKIQVLFKGNLLLPSTFDADFYGFVQGKNIGYILSNFNLMGMRWRQGQGMTQVWGNWRHGQFTKVHGLFDLHQVQVYNANYDIDVHLDTFRQNVLWQTHNQGWTLLSNPYYYHQNKMTEDPSRAILLSSSKQQDLTHWEVYFGEIDIGILGKIVSVLPWVSPQQRAQLLGISPQGLLQTFYLKSDRQHQAWTNTELHTQFWGLQSHQWQGFPAVNALSGEIHLTTENGEIKVFGSPLYVGENQVFSTAWPESELQLMASFQRHPGAPWRVNLKQLLLTNKQLKYLLEGTIDVPEDLKQWRNMTLNLTGGLQLDQAEKVIRSFIPTGVIDRDLDQWLKQAIVDLPKAQASILVRGPLSALPYPQHQGVMNIDAKFYQMDFRPDKVWPVVHDLNADLHISGEHFTVEAKGGKSYGLQLQSIKALSRDATKTHPKMIVATVQVEGRSEQAQRFIHASPLNKDLGEINNFITAEGPLTADFTLTVPQELGAKSSTKGVLTFKNNTVNFIGSPIKFTHLAGSFHFADDLIFADQLTSELWGRPVAIKIKTLGKSSDNETFKRIVSISGDVDVAEMLHKFDFPLSDNIFGKMPVEAKLTLTQTKTLFSLTSSLKGVRIKLPAPFSKQASAILPTQISADLTDRDRIPVIIQLGNMLTSHLLFMKRAEQFGFYSGQVLIGLSNAVHLPKDEGLYIDGILPYISVEAWVKAFQPYIDQLAHTSTSEHKELLKHIKLQVGQLDLYNRAFENVLLALQPIEQELQVKLKGKQVKGTLVIPDDWSKQYVRADFDYLYFQTPFIEAHPDSKQPGSVKAGIQKASQYLTAKGLQKIPPLSASVQSLYWQDRDLGSVSWVSQPIDHGIAIKKLALDNANFAANVSASITQSGQYDQYQVKGVVNGKDWGESLVALGYDNVMHKGKGTVDVNLGWLGNGVDVQFGSLSGSLAFKLENGALLAINPGFARLLGLTDIGSLFDRLKLSSEDVGSKGLAFDEIEGSYNIRNGMASTQRVTLSGPSLDLLMKGRIDLVNEQLDQTIVVIPHVGGGVALAAGIIGGPIAAVAAWVGEKILANTILKDQGLVYKVIGPWDKPEVISLESYEKEQKQ